jgi:hypothetical protein
LKLFFEESINRTGIEMYALTDECNTCVRKCIWGNCILISSVRKVDSIADSKRCSVGKSHFLHNWLIKNSTAGFPYITDGMANIEICEEGKPYLAVGYYRL